MRNKRIVVLLAVIGAIIAACVACSNWEHQVFQTLAADQQVIQTVIADYNAGTIAQTPANYQAIEAAKAAHNTAVNAFSEYWKIKTQILAAQQAGAAAGASPTEADLQAATEAVNTAIADAAKVIAPIKALTAKK